MPNKIQVPAGMEDHVGIPVETRAQDSEGWELGLAKHLGKAVYTEEGTRLMNF